MKQFLDKERLHKPGLFLVPQRLFYMQEHHSSLCPEKINHDARCPMQGKAAGAVTPVFSAAAERDEKGRPTLHRQTNLTLSRITATNSDFSINKLIFYIPEPDVNMQLTPSNNYH